MKKFRAWVDGDRADPIAATCSSGACSKTFPLNLSSDGAQTIAVEVEDGVGLKSPKQTFTVTVDGTGPEFLSTAGFFKHHVMSWGRHDVHVETKDFAGSVPGVNQVKGSSFEGDLPEGAYLKQAAAISSTEVAAFHGSAVAKLVAAGGSSYAEIGNDTAKIARQAGRAVTISAYVRASQPGRSAQISARFPRTRATCPARPRRRPVGDHLDGLDAGQRHRAGAQLGELRELERPVLESPAARPPTWTRSSSRTSRR